MKKIMWEVANLTLGNLKALGKWIAVSFFSGVICGLIGTLFHKSIEYVTELRNANTWLLFVLPLCGLLIVLIYKLFRTQGQSTNDIIQAVNGGTDINLALLPSIFLSTILTHLGGGSVGREGAALQMGGSVGYHVGKLMRLDDNDIRTATMAGMAAFFTALFGTPIAATVFVLEVISVGVIYHAALIPCLGASLIAYRFSDLFEVKPTRFFVDAPGFSLPLILRIAVLGILCAFVSIIFVGAIHKAEHLAEKYLKNEWVRAVVGGVIIILLTLIYGSQRYNGAGMGVIEEALNGQVLPWDYLLKILFTAITLAAGYRGGEVVPSFFIGAVFGCFVGPLLGIPAQFAAAVGLVSVFCGVVNSPLASIFLSVELFGAQGLIFFAVACCMSYAFSGFSGLYSTQKILFDKVKAVYINIYTNKKHHDNDLS
ncbi:MAG: chloride channel protein [Lachnospiraceae bacterium]|nr:chloride channel protein [Lachnospiraceae bacterium]